MKSKKILLKLVLGALILDVSFLTWWVVEGGGNKFNERMEVVEKRLDTIIKREGYESELGDEVLVNKAAAEAVKSLKPEIESMQQEVVVPTPLEEVLGDSDSLREYFVPIGSGSTSKKEWADVPSLQATINGDRYGEIVGVYFEGSLRAINGKVEARLLNRTTSEVIHQSNIEKEGTEFSWVFSKPFEVSSGGKTYIVQMRSSTGELVEMNGGRLRIVARQK